MPRTYGCSDNSCMFGPPGGMGTNGGCRCLDGLTEAEKRLSVRRGVKALRERLAEIESTLAPMAAMWFDSDGDVEIALRVTDAVLDLFPKAGE